ncbi:hypothetical protein SAMN05421823_11282 [Catalinimonas alkaloidigena]|uniref:Uncharacterized protein n=2 Tax=Catalinimonas alkaloidigena TaxID=1075417 RepID=A0A1G9S9J5_9BACT|nr:hypothetical protein SAMN05421823_11282 [Catalinimonas alkaloidigena]
MRLQLMMHGLDIEASEDEKYDFVINIASGNASFDEITKWINDHLKK